MPRPLRPQFEGGVYHVTVRGVRRTDIFRTDADRRAFLHMLGATVTRYGWRCAAYCLMSNHAHLVIQTPEANIAAGMQVLNSRYAQWFNGTYGLEGHVFERRYGTVVVEQMAHLAEAARYVVLNPVRAGLCEHPADWLWSSYRATAGLVARPVFLDTSLVLGQFTSPTRSRRAAYVRFVADRLEARSRTDRPFRPCPGSDPGHGRKGHGAPSSSRAAASPGARSPALPTVGLDARSPPMME